MKAIEARMIDTISWKERSTMLIDAYLYKPQSMDALHALAQDHFDSGRFHLSYLYIHRAVHIKRPPGLEVVENVLLRPTQYLYDYEGFRLMGFAAREIGEWESCVAAFRKVLSVQPNDEIVKNRINLCETKLKEMGITLPTPAQQQQTDNTIPVVVKNFNEKTPNNEIVLPPRSNPNPTIVTDPNSSSDSPGMWDSFSSVFCFLLSRPCFNY